MSWQVTHGLVVGAYLRVGANELYVRKDGPKSWLWFIDGFKMGSESSEPQARAAAECAVRPMARTHVGTMAAPAG